MGKGIEFRGIYKRLIVVNNEMLHGIRLPDEWNDDSFKNTTFVYEKAKLSQYDSAAPTFFSFYIDDRIYGDKHITNKDRRLTRISRDGRLILPEDLLAYAQRKGYEEIFFCGKGTYFEIRFTNPDSDGMFSTKISETAAKFISLFDKED